MATITRGKPAARSKSSILVTALACLGILVASHAVRAQSDTYREAFTAYQVQDFETAGTIWQSLAEQGDHNAQYALGVMELRGEVDNASKEKAFRWFQLAANQGHSTAMFNVGVAYWEGSGVSMDRSAALEWWEKSAEAGDSGAQFNLGLAYYLGEERPEDIDTAVRWIGMAAEQNHPEARRILDIITSEQAGAAGEPALTASADSTDSEPSVGTETTGETSLAAVAPVETEATDAAAAVVEPAPAEETREYWRTATSVALRVDPGSDARVFQSLPQGTPIEIIDSDGDWSRITLPAGLRMWVYESFLEVTDDNGVITGTGVRVRPKPTTDNEQSPPVGAYRNGDRVKVLESREQWHLIRAPKHVGGWTETANLEAYRDTRDNREASWQAMVDQGL